MNSEITPVPESADICNGIHIDAWYAHIERIGYDNAALGFRLLMRMCTLFWIEETAGFNACDNGATWLDMEYRHTSDSVQALICVTIPNRAYHHGFGNLPQVFPSNTLHAEACYIMGAKPDAKSSDVRVVALAKWMHTHHAYHALHPAQFADWCDAVYEFDLDNGADIWTKLVAKNVSEFSSLTTHCATTWVDMWIDDVVENSEFSDFDDDDGPASGVTSWDVPQSCSNISEAVSHGYGLCDKHGFWMFQIPETRGTIISDAFKRMASRGQA